MSVSQALAVSYKDILTRALFKIEYMITPPTHHMWRADPGLRMVTKA